MFKRKPNKNTRIDTLIGAKTRINGDVEFAGGFHLDGHINGNVTCQDGPDALLSVSEHGCIEGSVLAPNVLLNGTVKGNIDASERVELGAKARVLGNVQYTVIETAVGAQISGKLIHRTPSPGPREGAGSGEGAAAGQGAASGQGAEGSGTRAGESESQV
ncbi:MAG TPA: polymer-forming cytoskeletal protein [Steroidobacteraceae bacterium]|nr:polymer-forming cytoskeletal protein [Steroidobacteraceae bacterium]